MVCILVVEDDDLIQLVTAGLLEELGFGVELAGTASEAASRLVLLAESIDAAVIDMRLPDADGDVLVRKLRTIIPALPVVISSGYDQSILRSKFVGTERIAFLGKPFTQEQLRDTMDQLGVKAKRASTP